MAQVTLTIPDEAIAAWNAVAQEERPGSVLTPEQLLAISAQEIRTALAARLKARKAALAQRSVADLERRLASSFSLTPAE